MLIRYKKGTSGPIPIAKIYTKEEHKINIKQIDRDAIKVIVRLKQRGFDAYIVGGAVRDLLLGRVPKDFDITTNASPRQIHKLFYQARVIGKRFKLVHLVYPDKIIEVSTFRGISEDENEDNSNIFGTIEEDAKRRDFTINALYYDPIEQIIVDFNDSLNDFKNKKIVSVLPLNHTFIEDPVRMLRAIKYSITTGFKMNLSLKIAIRRSNHLLAGVPNSRLTEEVFKILGSGCSAQIIKALDRYGLLVYIMPCLCVYTKFEKFYESLRKLDEKENNSQLHGGTEANVEHWEFFKFLTESMIINSDTSMTAEEHFKDIFRQIKVFISPITPPNYDIELAVENYMIENGFKTPKGNRCKPAIAKANQRQKTYQKKPIKNFRRPKQSFKPKKSEKKEQ